MKTRDLNLKAAAVALGLCAFLVQSAHAGFTLQGNYLDVGVGDDGSIINQTGGFEETAPSNYTGIIYDQSGTGNFSVNNDFITPGSPFQMYSIGVDGDYGIASYEADGGTPGLNGVTVQTSATSTKTTGSIDGIDFTQTLSFGANSGVINFSITLTNSTDATLNNIAFATGLDPDPDVYQYGSYYTNNTVVEPGVVEGIGPDTTNSITIQGVTPGADASILENWPAYNPYDLLTTENDGDGDYSIFDAWSLGSLAAGASTTVNYNYIINGTPVTSSNITVITGGAPDLGSTLAMFGFVLAGLGAVRRKFKA